MKEDPMSRLGEERAWMVDVLVLLGLDGRLIEQLLA
jgi:hypothetical protein